MKKVVSILSAILIFFTVAAPYNTYANIANEPIEGVKSTISGYGTSEDTEKIQSMSAIKNDITYSTNSNKYIMLKQSSIHDIGNGIVSIQASTKTNENVDKLGLMVYLERWSNNSWVTVKTWSSDKSSSNSIEFITVHSVNSNDVYRIRAVHTAYKGTVSELDQTVTSYITVK